MVDNNHDLKNDQPRYFGVATQLTKGMFYGTTFDEKSSDQIDDYFIDTPVHQWSARSFLKSNSDSAAFIVGLDKIRRRRSVDNAIRSYTTWWFKFLEGDLGRLRLDRFLAEIKTSITHGVIIEEERHLAQQHLRGHIREATDGITSSLTYKKSVVSPFVKPFDPEPTSSSLVARPPSSMQNPFLSKRDTWKDFAYFTSFGQSSTWTHGTGSNAVDFLTLFKAYQAASKDSLALDMIADVSAKGSEQGTFTEWIKKKHGMHHFTFGNAVRTDINEREVFVDCTWSFIRTALTTANIPSRMMEVTIDGKKDRKTETKQKGVRQNTPRKADGVGLYNGNQVYVAEAARIYGAALGKKEDDAWKVKRAMRDSWVYQLRRMCKTERPTAPLVVFGSTSHLDTTKFFAMDFVGCFRVSPLSTMVVPLESNDFAKKMQPCMLTCLSFATILLAESDNRKKATLITDDEKEELLELATSIPATSMSPVKLSKD
ncbi:MAG: hypothetical protein J3Q66DRAFT_370820 [Benniella sp.]|nr:MAG: hypothetical protein J3Q66DRAFT_370820 [Benniella sp.]